MPVHIYEPSSSNSRLYRIVNIKDEGNHRCGASFSVSFEMNMQISWTRVLMSVPRSHCLHSILKWSGNDQITWTGLHFPTRITDLLINHHSPVSIPRFRRLTCDLFTSCVFRSLILHFRIVYKSFLPCTASDLILQIHGVQQYRLGGYSWTAKLGDTRILEPFDFAVTFLFISFTLVNSFFHFLPHLHHLSNWDTLVQYLEALRGTGYLHTFCLFSFGPSMVCFVFYHIINCLVSLWRISRVSGHVFTIFFFFLSISSTPAFGAGFQLSHNLDILQHSSLARLQ